MPVYVARNEEGGLCPGCRCPLNSSESHCQDCARPLKEFDEFRFGIWWRRAEDGMLRDASLSECATEIQRLRAENAHLRSVNAHLQMRIGKAQTHE